MRINDLSPEQRRIMLAKAAGWSIDEGDYFAVYDLKGRYRGGSSESLYRALKNAEVPDFDTDLIACHGLEAKLTDEQHHKFRIYLRMIAGCKPGLFSEATARAYVSARPDQRASALILTLVEGMEP